MRRDPLAAYKQAMSQLRASIDDCLSEGRVLSCLTLLYSAIDVLASIDGPPGTKTQEAFVRWVDAYLLPDDCLHFSSIDLYAARCGIIHSFSANSHLSKVGKAKKIVYAWGTASADTLFEAGQALGRNEISVHVADLADAFYAAVVKYIEEVSRHPDQHQLFLESIGHWLVGVDPALFDDFLAVRHRERNGNS